MTVAIRLALAGAVALAAAFTAWSVGEEPPDAAERREAIANMTEAERDQLRRRYDDFRRLSDAEREAVRQLHKAVQDDPSLGRALDEYERFVSGLDPWEQADLRRLDPTKRLERVERLVAERRRRDGPGRPSWLAAGFEPDFILPPPQLDQAMTLVVDALGLSESEREDLPTEPKRDRHLTVARHMAAKSRPHRGDPVWMDDATAHAIIESLPEGRFRGFLLHDSHSPEFRRKAAIALLMRSLFAEWRTDAMRVVDRNEFRKALEELPERQQAESQRRDPNELLQLVMQAVAKHGGPAGEFAERFDEVSRLWNEFDWFAPGHRGRRSGRSPFRPPGERRDDSPDRRRDDDRGGRNGRDDDERP